MSAGLGKAFMRIRHLWIVLTGALFSLLAACTTPGDDYDLGNRAPDGTYAVYAGGRYGEYGVGGKGAKLLDPWLSGTQPGQRLVLAFFDHNYNGRIGPDRAGEANRWFRRFADRDHDLRITDNEINRGLVVLDRKLRQRGY
jgi:hypothetical protein